MESVEIINKIDGFKKDTQKMSVTEKLHYAVGYFKDYEDIYIILRHIANISCQDSEKVEKSAQYEKSNHKMNFPISEHINNLRYVIGDAMEKLYGKYDSADEDKFGSIVGVDIGVIGKFVHDGEINEEDFEKVCTYLNPMEQIKNTWKRFYVRNVNNISHRSI